MLRAMSSSLRCPGQSFWRRFATIRARHDVLRHPFYERWSAGELGEHELAHYAGQYRHAVVALARAADRAAASAGDGEDPGLAAELSQHAREERSHVELWDAFCRAVGGSPHAEPAPETQVCAGAWAGDRARPLLRSLAALHAIEASQPAIAAAKRHGLLTHYHLSEGPATAYFSLHERLDAQHAAASRRLIDSRLTGDEGQAEGLLGEAEAVLRANWSLLDGVERASRSAAPY